MKNLRAYFENLIKLEQEYNLFFFKIKNINIWNQIRMEVYFHSLEKENFMEAVKTRNNNKIVSFIKSLNAIIFHNHFKLFQKVDYLVISHSRLQKYHNEYIDIYTENLINNFKLKSKSYLILEDSYNFKHLRRRKDIYFLDLLYLLRFLYSKLYINKYSDKDRKNIDLLSKLFGINYNFIDKSLKKFQITYYLYKKLFKIIQPKKIYLIVGYGKSDIIKAAKELNIEVIEIMHGVISSIHIGHNNRKNNDPMYFPDKFLTWGTYWSQQDIYHLKEDKKIVCGNWYFNELREKYKLLMKNKEKQIIVLSQDGIGNMIMGKLLEIIDYLNDYTIIYKLHPTELKLYKQYLNLEKLTCYSNFKIVTTDYNLYKGLAESEYQIGVFSTAIFEGLGMDCKTLLFDLPGIEYMEDLINRKYAYLVHENNILDLLSDQSKFAQFNSEEFFSKEVNYYVE